jgi:hypothetical protein
LLARTLEIREAAMTTILTEAEVAAAALDLFAASSLDRYVRMAMVAASRSSVGRRLDQEPDAVGPEIKRMESAARDLLRLVCRARQRTLSEASLAILLCLLARNASPLADELLGMIGLMEHPTARWLAALARRLREDQAENQVVPAALLGLRSPARNSAATETCSRVPRSVQFWSDESDSTEQFVFVRAA